MPVGRVDGGRGVADGRVDLSASLDGSVTSSIDGGLAGSRSECEDACEGGRSLMGAYRGVRRRQTFAILPKENSVSLAGISVSLASISISLASISQHVWFGGLHRVVVVVVQRPSPDGGHAHKNKQQCPHGVLLSSSVSG